MHVKIYTIYTRLSLSLSLSLSHSLSLSIYIYVNGGALKVAIRVL